MPGRDNYGQNKKKQAKEQSSTEKDTDLYRYEYDRFKNVYYEQEILTGSATCSIENESHLNMKVSSQNDKVVYQSEQYFRNTPTNIKNVIFNCILSCVVDNTGYCQKIGLFDDHDNKTAGNDVGGSGYFFTLIDNMLNIGYRNGTTDNGTDILVDQDNFNYYKLESHAYSFKFWNNIQTFKIEYDIYGKVQFLLKINSSFVLLHQLVLDDHLVHNISRYNLPFRLEITKTGVEANISSLKLYSIHIFLTNNFTDDYILEHIALKSKKSKIYTIPTLIDNGYVNINSNNYEPIFSIKLKDTNVRSYIYKFSIYIFIKTDGYPFILSIFKNPTFSGNQPSWQDTDIENSILEFDDNANNYNSNSLTSELFNNRYNIFNGIETEITLDLTSSIEGTPNIYSFGARKVNASSPNIIVSIKWKE